MSEPLHIGGQAVIEGVMMRSPHAMVTAVRKQSGEIVLKEAPWRSIWERLKFLRWPVFRGSVVLVESLVNGIQALTFSAQVAMEEEAAAAKAAEEEEPEGAPGKTDEAKADGGGSGGDLSSWDLTKLMVVTFAAVLLIFKGVPHFLAWLCTSLLGIEDGVNTPLFHLIDGLVKLGMFVGYVAAIGRMQDMRRVFQYHGAEHMSIHAHEAGLELTVDEARQFPAAHPRCGTSFIILVLMAGMVVFTASFAFMPRLHDNGIVNNLLYVLIKIPLLLPIAGVAYEIVRLGKRWPKNLVVRLLTTPGIWLQGLTTRKPDDSQLEVALASLRGVLEIEASVASKAAAREPSSIRTFSSYLEIGVKDAAVEGAE